MKSRLLSVLSAAVLSLGLAGGVRAADPSFSVKLDVPAAKKGEKATVKVHIRPGTGYHMNKEFPTALALVAPAGVTIEKPKQAAKDAAKFEDAGCDFDVVLTATEPGSKVVTGDLKFAVCTATSCDPKKEKVSFTVDVK